MKNRALYKYLGQLAVYTIIFIAVSVIISILFFQVGYSFFTKFLTGSFRNIAAEIYDFVYRKQFQIMIIAYIAGFLGITVHTVFRLGKLLELAANAVEDENSVVYGNGCPDMLRDFSASLKRSREKALISERARQLAEQQKNDLIVYLSHDLKTPLTSVIGYLSILDDLPDMPTEQRARFIGITLDKAYRLEQLINEFFEITRLNLSELTAEKTGVDLSVMLFQLIEEFYPLLEENNMTITADIDSGIKLSADADKLARALDNLLKNAVNYGWNGTEIKLSAHLSGENAVITLSNKGDEIPQEKLARIFDKFCRLDSSRRSKTGGTGLGLAITKQIIELHGGTISAACDKNDITFTVMVPI